MFNAATSPHAMLYKFMPYATLEQGTSVNDLMRSGYSFVKFIRDDDTHAAVAVLQNTDDVVIVYPDNYRDVRTDKSIELVRDF